MRALAETELLRARWRRARGPLGMIDPLDEGFVQGDLGACVTPSLRVVLLPTDPEASVLRVDDEFWGWWKKVNPSPPGTRLCWGQNPTLSASGTFRGEHDAADVPWERYVAVRRHGGVELGARVAVHHADKLFVPLLHVVALVWSALRLQWLVHEHVDLEGPWEVSVGLRDIGGSTLGQYAEGWEQPLTAFNRGRRCDDAAVLLRREAEVWPIGETAVRDLAFDMADLVEQCWGIRQRAYLIPEGDRQGQFDGSPLT